MEKSDRLNLWFLYKTQNHNSQSYISWTWGYTMLIRNTAQKMKFSIKDFFSKYDQIRIKLKMI